MARGQSGTPDWEKRYPGAEEVKGAEGWNWQWSKIGQELVGVFLSCEVFKNGHKAKVRDVDGVVRLFSAPDVLADLLANIERGQQIAIVFTGEKPSSTAGRSATKYFKVFKIKA